MRYSDLVPQFMHLCKAISLGRAHREYTAEVHSTALTLQIGPSATYHARTGTCWHLEWVVVIGRAWLHMCTFQLNHFNEISVHESTSLFQKTCLCSFVTLFQDSWTFETVIRFSRKSSKSMSKTLGFCKDSSFGINFCLQIELRYAFAWTYEGALSCSGDYNS